MEMPKIMYGTAWKENATTDLVLKAAAAGFRAIDTANQRKHYHELAVGEALRTLFAQGAMRESLFIQTKYTLARGQDHRIPYDPHADFPTQVRQSFASSLEHLGVDFIDSYLIHGPSEAEGLNDGDVEVWRTFEELQQAGQIGMIGVSNFSPQHLRQLLEVARVAPKVVQNRCFAVHGWDQEVRALCNANGILYQGFSLLTANRHILQAPVVLDLARRYQATVPQIVFAFAMKLGMVVLTGTTNENHMAEDLKAEQLELSAAEVESILAVG